MDDNHSFIKRIYVMWSKRSRECIPGKTTTHLMCLCLLFGLVFLGHVEYTEGLPTSSQGLNKNDGKQKTNKIKKYFYFVPIIFGFVTY